ncbi:MAG: phosphoethanolamine transferase CptA [Bacteroidales bacterium]|jgi:hypothetical protein|nr:phosphoethanolamine transferase CptA [Bacteroidales bacterium]
MYHYHPQKRYIPLFMLAVVLLVTLIAMLLWNRLMPALFGAPSLSYFQTLGLLVLARLFVGLKVPPPHPHRHFDCCPEERKPE